jgi:hypothetical protein
MEMLRRVLALRLVTASDVTTFTTHSEMNPCRSHLEALLTPFGSSRVDFMNMVEMRTLRLGHQILLHGNVGHSGDSNLVKRAGPHRAIVAGRISPRRSIACSCVILA